MLDVLSTSLAREAASRGSTESPGLSTRGQRPCRLQFARSGQERQDYALSLEYAGRGGNPGLSCSPFALVVAERRSGNAPRTAARVAMSREVSEFDLPGSGKLAFSDARPIFRAPLVLVGDGD